MTVIRYADGTLRADAWTLAAADLGDMDSPICPARDGIAGAAAVDQAGDDGKPAGGDAPRGRDAPSA